MFSTFFKANSVTRLEIIFKTPSEEISDGLGFGSDIIGWSENSEISHILTPTLYCCSQSIRQENFIIKKKRESGKE